jgi:protein phosphatase
MGGHAAGEVAAETAVAVAAKYLRDSKSLLDVVGGTSARRLLALELAKRAVQKACQEVHRLSTRFAHYRGMGTTLTLLLTVDDQAVVAHVGDSRLYLLREDQVRLLTSDHTLQNELACSGLLPTDRHLYSRFGHMLTRSVGESPSVKADTEVLSLLPGDRLLLCTDGLSKYLDDDNDIVGLLSGHDNNRVMASLVDFARTRGGSDNITAIVVWVATDELRPRPSGATSRHGNCIPELV